MSDSWDRLALDAYDSIFEPDGWPDLIARIARALEADAALIVSGEPGMAELAMISAGEVRSPGTFRGRGESAVFHLCRSTPAGVVMRPSETIPDLPRDFAVPHARHDVGLNLVWSDCFATLALHRIRDRRFSDGEVAPLPRFSKYLGQAIRLYRQYGGFGETAPQPISSSTNAVCIVEGAGRVGPLTPAGEKLLSDGDVLASRRGRLYTLHPKLREEISLAFSTSSGNLAGTGGTVQDADFRATVIPLRGSGTRRPRVAVLVEATPARWTRLALQLRDRFRLTWMEAEVAIALAKGSAPKKISERLGISVHTVRTHLYRCFDKLGVRRQAELVVAVLRSPVDDG